MNEELRVTLAKKLEVMYGAPTHMAEPTPVWIEDADSLLKTVLEHQKEQGKDTSPKVLPFPSAGWIEYTEDGAGNPCSYARTGYLDGLYNLPGRRVKVQVVEAEKGE